MEDYLGFRDIQFLYIGIGIGIGCVRIDELDVLMNIQELIIKQEEDEDL